MNIMAGTYSLDPVEVRKVIDLILAGKPYDKDQFRFYHFYRNHFNVKNEVTTLKRLKGRQYADNNGNVWERQITLKNFFHMPHQNYFGTMLGLAKPYSVKYLRDDNESGVGGEYEMVIRYDGKRIDALTCVKYQETYNFGRTRTVRAHKLLDMDPHDKDTVYMVRQDTGHVTFID